MGGIDWLFGAVLAGFLAHGVCGGLLVESLAFLGLLASAAPAIPGVLLLSPVAALLLHDATPLFRRRPAAAPRVRPA